MLPESLGDRAKTRLLGRPLDTEDLAHERLSFLAPQEPEARPAPRKAAGAAARAPAKAARPAEHVEPSDFPFLPDVTGHSPGEPIGRIVVRATLLRALQR